MSAQGFTDGGDHIAEHDSIVGGYISPWTSTIPDPSYVSYLGTGVSWTAAVEAGGVAAWSPRASGCFPGSVCSIYVWAVSGGANGPGYGPVDDDSDGGGGRAPGCGGCCGGGGDGGSGPTGPGDGDGPLPDFLDSGAGPIPDGIGMPVWRISEPYLSVWLHDEPLGYQPSLGSRVALRLAYKQRESTAGMVPDVFSVGQKWDFSWFSYVTLGPFGTNNIVHFSSGMTRTFQGSTDYMTNVRLTGDMTNGYTLYYLDGSSDVYKCIVGGFNLFFQPVAFRTQHLDPQSQPTTFNYVTNASPYGSVVRLATVVDGSGGTNLISYNSTNLYSTNLISKVTDPYGRSVKFSYNTNGVLTNVVDVAGISSSFSYDTNIYVTNLTTPYGATTFAVIESPDTNAPPIGRSVRITDPDGSSELYLCRDLAPGVASSYSGSAVPTTSPIPNLFDTANLNVRNTFHWYKKQYSNLSTTNILSLTTNDFRLAGMKHWLLTGNSQIGATLSMERDPSPDNAGAIEGQKTWYDYAGKTNSQYEGAQVLPLIRARVLPDGTTAFKWVARNTSGAVTTNISTFGIGASTGLRTNIFTYGTNQIDLYTATNAVGARSVSNAFNAYHEVIANYDALNETVTYTYDTNQRPTSVTLATGLVITNIYGTDGFLAQQIETGIATNSYTYTNALVFTHTDPVGLTTTNKWDGLQRLASRAYPDSTYISNQYTRLDLTATKDRLGHWSYFGYDQLRHRIAATNTLGAFTLFSYCSCGALEEIRDPLGNLTYFNYDNQIRRASILFPDGYNVTNSYDLTGRLTNRIDGSGLSVTDWFNNQGLRFASSNASGQAFFQSFDILDRVTNRIDQNGVVTATTYDSLNRIATRSYPDGGVERFGYSAAGLIAHTNQLNNITYYGDDPAGRRLAETNALGYVTRYSYDGLGNLLKLTDPNNNVTSWGHDLYGRITNEVDATGASIFVYGYDANGRLTNRWSAARGTTSYGYDSAGNLTGVTYPLSPSLTYSYNAANWMTQMSDGFGTTSFTYTPGGQLASENGPLAQDAVAYTYANRARSSTSLQQPYGAAWTETYAYDGSQRLSAVTSPAGQFAFSYNSGLAGRACCSSLIAKIALPNGSYGTNTYDTHGRVATNGLYNSGGSLLDSFNYTYDQGNQRTAVVRDNENTASYSYDAIGEVVADQSSEVSGGTARLNEQLHYLFDPVGNLVFRTNNALIENFRVNTVNEFTANTNGGTLTVSGTTVSPATGVSVNGTTASLYGDYTFAASGLALTTTYTATASDAYGRHSTGSVAVNVSTNVAFQYDGNGNLTNDGLRNFVYDDENELIQVSVSNAWMSQFQYDGKMRRRLRKEFTWRSGAWAQTNAVYYIYDGNLVIQERDGNNLPAVTYTRGNDLSGTFQGAGGVGGLLARTSQSYADASLSGQAYYHSDANGNVTSIIDNHQGIIARYLYDAFGNTIAKSGLLADANVYRFSGREWHEKSGLVYYLYRYYDPNLQRWPNRDPIGDLGFANMRNQLYFHIRRPYLRASPQTDLYSFINNRAPNDIDIFGLIDCAALEQEIDELYTRISAVDDRGGNTQGLEERLERLENIWGRLCRPPPETPPGVELEPDPDPCPINIDIPRGQPPNTHNHEIDPPRINWWPWLKWVAPFLIPWPGNPVYGFV